MSSFLLINGMINSERQLNKGEYQMKLNVEINDHSTTIILPDEKGKITIASQSQPSKNAVNLDMKNGKLAGLQLTALTKKQMAL